ncbi:MAG: PAS domain S-box protein [Acidobacteriota bacterium]
MGNTIDELRHETDVPVVIADQDGFITYINGRFNDVFGWTLDEVIGKPLTILIPKNLHDAHHLGFSRFLMTGNPTLLNRPLKLKTLLKDGSELYTEHFIIAEQQQGHWVFGARLCPIND